MRWINLATTFVTLLALWAPQRISAVEHTYYLATQPSFEEPEIVAVPEFIADDLLLANIRFTFSLTNHGPGKLNPLYTCIAIPIDRPHQEVLKEAEFSPEPNAILADEWGQGAAYYEEVVDEGGFTEYTYEITVKTTDYDYQLVPENVGDMSDIPQEIIEEYTADAENYDITNLTIANAADEAVGDETRFYWMVRKLHDYVIWHLHYELDGRWDPALQVLEQGHGSCSEYTWLMIALCRAKGIPARYVGGSYLKTDPPYRDEVYHRWTEVYFPNCGWISIDCTWDDKPSDQHRYFGKISRRLFATTVAGGLSEHLRWS